MQYKPTNHLAIVQIYSAKYNYNNVQHFKVTNRIQTPSLDTILSLEYKPNYLDLTRRSYFINNARSAEKKVSTENLR